MKTINQNINNWNHEFVEMSKGLGLSNAKCGRKAEWIDYFLLGQFIFMCPFPDYKKKGYVEDDYCDWIWAQAGLERPMVNESMSWLASNGYINQIHIDKSRLAYQVPQWVLDKAEARKTKRLIDEMDALISELEKVSQDESGIAYLRGERDSLKKKYDMLISRLKNVNCGVCEEAER